MWVVFSTNFCSLCVRSCDVDRRYKQCGAKIRQCNGYSPGVNPIESISQQLRRYFSSPSQCLGHLRKCFLNYKETIYIGLTPGVNPIEVIYLQQRRYFCSTSQFIGHLQKYPPNNEEMCSIGLTPGLVVRAAAQEEGPGFNSIEGTNFRCCHMLYGSSWITS